MSVRCRKLVLAPTFVVMIWLAVFSSVAQPQAIEAARADALQQVSQAIAGSVDAWNKGDLEGHIAIYADSATAGPPFAAEGRDRARRLLGRYFTDARPALRIDNLDLRPLGRDFVLATGRYRLTGNGTTEAGWFTEIWQYTARSWRIVHEHSTPE